MRECDLCPLPATVAFVDLEHGDDAGEDDHYSCDRHLAQGYRDLQHSRGLASDDCAHCGQRFWRESKGRPRLYCSPRCRTAAYRAARDG